MGSRLVIHEVEWDEHNVDHVETHGVRWREAHEALTGWRPRVVKPNIRPAREPLYVCYGRSDSGRYVTVIFVYRLESQVARPITAWEMNDAERGIYGREAPAETR